MTIARKNPIGRASRRAGTNRPRRPSRKMDVNRSDPSSFSASTRQYDRYMALARQAAADGDLIEAESMFQHAEHYLRQMQE